MLQTYGLTHIALKVKDLDKSRLFYQQMFGCKVMYETDKFVQIQTPGANDIIVLEKAGEVSQNDNRIIHFGFRLKNPQAVDFLIEHVKKAGGQIKEAGEFVPGEPYVFLFDPDGYEIEIWYEKIPPALSSFN